jgi:hypothetical protein
MRARLLEADATLMTASGPAGAGAALDRVRGSLFEPPTGPAIQADGTLRLVSAPDPSREARGSEGVP